jgi:hypothetical protein
MSKPLPLDQAGQVEILRCSIMKSSGFTIDIMPQLDFVNIYEDIYSPFMSGYIVLSDTYDLPGVIGRSGRDMLYLTIKTPSMNEPQWINRVFYIYKMTNRTEFKDRLQGYKLHFVSSEFATDIMRTTSKLFSGTPSSIVASILDDQLKTDLPLISEDTTNNVKYTSNFWSPSKNLAYLAEHATNTNGAASYLFYENRDGFNFRSLDSINQEKTLMNDFHGNDFISDVNTVDGAMRFASAQRDPIQSYKSVLELKIETTYDFLKDYKAGMIKSKMYSHDLLTKQLAIRNFNLEESNLTANNINRLYDNITVGDVEPILLNLNRHTDVFDNGDISNFRWNQRRLTDMGMFQSSKIQIGVFGRTDYTVGRKVSVDFNRMMQLTPGDDSSVYIDKMYSGEYISTAVVHKISRDEHRCSIELSKSHTNIS